ncbi:amino acid adenylation domain-containing protein [Pseudonocardia alni]|uniref:Amino acid adenylation domain-containing protein n=3 Tax=Pseudonocardia alni TaxID=33907 RepID=A0ABU9AKD0_PSEA5
MTSLDERKRALIARRLAEAGLRRSDPAAAPRRAGRTEFPLSFAQRRMWLHHQIVPDSTAFNLCIELTLDGDLDETALRAAFDALVARHEVLRTTYHAGDDGDPFQRVHDTLGYPWEVLDAPGTDAAARRAWVRELARERASRPYDLAADSALRVAVVREGPARTTVLLQVHHIAWDGLTFAVISRDLERAYRQARDGAVTTTPPPRQVADFADAEQRAWADGDGGAGADAAYWREQLAEPVPALFDRLPAEDPAADVEAGGRVDRRFSPAAAQAVRELSAQLGTTPYTVVLACYSAVLSRFAGTGDVTVGTAVVNREDSGVTELVGNFGNLVVLRSAVRADDTVRSLTGRVAAVAADGFGHQGFPYDRLVELLNPSASGQARSLFEAQLLFLTQKLHGPQLPGTTTSWLRTDNGTAQHPLALEVFLTDDGFDVEATYAAAHLTADAVSTLLADLEALLEDAGDDPDRRLADIFTTRPVHRSVTGTDRGPRWTPADALGPGAAARAGEVALVGAPAPGRAPVEVTVAELDDAADRVAAALRARGIGPEDRVAVLLPRTTGLATAVLGVLRAGAVLVPVDPGYPAARIRHVLTDSAPALVITDGAVTAPAGAAGAATATVADLSTGPAPDRPFDRPHPDQAAYLVYTSGSTGVPKGVLGTHRGLARRLDWADRAWPVEPGDVRVAKSSIAFIDGVTELLAALARGARVLVADDATATEPEALARLLRTEPVAQVTAVPSLVSVLAETPGPVAVRRWVCSGEPLTATAVAAARAWAPGSVVVNSYGSSEVAGDVLAGEVVGDERVTAGRVVPGSTVVLLDRFLAPVPDGVVGELYVGGEQVARGYAGRAGETAARFVADPAVPGARLYRTGDLARRLPDGRFELLGRADDQVTVRGVRVEPGEVEAVLVAQPGVRSAVVVARTVGDGPSLVAYVVPAEHGDEPVGEDLRAAVAQRLPSQFVPAAVVVLPELPRTPGGKIDKRALPAPGRVHAGSRPPGDDRERALCALFSELLDRTGIGVDDDFFALGGHSLSALRLANRVQARLGAPVTVPDVFARPTVAGLAALVAGRDPAGTEDRDPATGDGPVRRPDTAPAVLAPAQHPMWTLYRMQGPGAAYNVPREWTVDGPFDAGAFRAALHDVVARHDALRTTYGETADGTVTVHVHPAGELPVHVGTGACDEAGADATLAALVGHRFDLEREAPVRAEVVRTAADRHRIGLVCHHIAVDEWSLRVLLADLGTAYAARRAGRTPALPAPPLRHGDVAAWQAGLVGTPQEPTDRARRQLDFWADRLTGAPPVTTLPTDRPRPEAPGGGGAELRTEFGPELAAALGAAAQRHGTSMFMLLHGALAVLLEAHADADRDPGDDAGDAVVIGTPVSARRHAGAEDVVGFALTTLALRLDMHGDPTLAEVLDRARTADLAAMEHADVPFDRVVDRVAPERGAASPLFQVELLYLRTDPDRSELDLDGAVTTAVRTGTGSAKFDATFAFHESVTDAGDPRLGVIVEYATELYDATTIEAVLARLERLLELVASAPGTRLSQLRLDPPAPGPDPAPTGADGLPATLAALFTATVAARPDAPALVAGAERLTWAGLADRAGRLAAVLVADGVRPGDRVAVGVPRGADMVVAMLAVALAGATAVPLDVESPASRLALIVGDARPHCMLAVATAPGAVTGLGPRVVAVDAVAPDVAALPGPVTVPAAQPAYVVYTSGSTGRPKGVEVPHRAVLSLLAATVAPGGTMDVTADDVFSLVHSIAFDVSVFELWGAVATGATVVVVDGDTARDPERLWALIAAERVSVLSQTPSAFGPLALAEPAGSAVAESLRYVVFAGEALEPRLLRDWCARHTPGAPVLANLYGITETTVHTTYREIGTADLDRPVSPVGGPLAGLAVRLLDRRLRPVPRGVVGEIHVAGAQLAQGYADRPGLTAVRFVADPDGPPGTRLYRSGDLARFDRAGELEFAGRADEQVKIRGYRVELGEVDAGLLALPGIAQAVTRVHTGTDPADRRLVGYVVPAPGAAADPAALRSALGDLLPGYMVPAAIVVLDRLPLTVNGKLDRRALPEPDFGGGPAATDREPADDVERTLCAAFAHVLGAGRVGPDDDFFALGGDSILATRVVRTVREAGLDVRTAHVFAHRTPAGMARAAGTAPRAARADTRPLRDLLGLGPADVAALGERVGGTATDVWPLSPLQEGLYFQSVYDTSDTSGSAAGGDVYILQTVFTLDRALDRERLEGALARLVAATPLLRVAFTTDDRGRPVQVVRDHLPDLPVTERTAASMDAARALAVTERAQPIPLDAPPLFRLLLVHLPDGRDRLVLTNHFQLFDGASAMRVADRLLTLHDGGEPPAAPGYDTYLRWTADQDEKTSREVWARAYADLTAPTLVAGEEQRSFTEPSSRIGTRLGVPLSDRVRAVAAGHGVTVNTVLIAALGVVLGHATGGDDVVLGTPMAVAPDEIAGMEHAVGLFLNTVPVRVRLAPTDTGADVLRRLGDERAGLVAHEYLGLGQIQQATGRPRLFDTLFTLRNAWDAFAEAAQRHGMADVETLDDSHFPLSFAVNPFDDMELTVDHRPEAVDTGTARQLMDRFVAVLDALTATPGAPLATIDPGVAPHTDDTAAPVPDATIAELLAERAARCPERTALVAGESRLSFAELDAQVTRTARVLRSRGAGPETVVALGLPRSTANVVALFAVLRAGAAYVPLELDHPDDRLAEILTASGASLLVTDSTVAPRFDRAVPQVRLDEPGLFDGVPDTPLTAEELGSFAPGTPGRLDHPAYVIFTSGSTGRPKGVVTPFRGLTNMQVNHRREIFAPTVDAAGGRVLRIAHTVSFAFDMSWEELLWLVEGHEVHVCDEQLRRDAERLVAYCAEHAVDVVNVTPTYAHHLFAAGLLDGPHVPPLVLLGGEAVPESVWSRLRDTDGTWGYNLYGPTEYTINTLGAGTSDSPTSTVGTAITNTTAHVLDGWLRPVPDGVIGELYIAGTGLARGYLDRPGLTAERFVADPWTPGARMYRTGDLVRRRPDGNLDFLGRSDDQLKIRGYRVEPGEIETALSAADGVSQAAVVARPHPEVPGQRRLAAYLVGTATPEAAREAVARTLPDYMVPTLWAVVEKLPLTVNGKLDVAALPEPAAIAPTGGRAPRTPLEETLCSIVAEVVGVDGVGPDDDFFDLGGDSISALALANRARKAGIRIRPRHVFEARTVTRLAPYGSRTAAARPALRPVQHDGPEREISAGQRQMLALSRVGGPSAVYNVPGVLRLHGPLDTDALRAAWLDVLGRHEVLRTTYPDGTTTARVLDLDAVGPAITAERIDAGDLDARIEAAVRAPFDLARAIPARVTLFELGPDEHVLVAVLHHIAVDEWSWRPLIDDLQTAYRARLRSGPDAPSTLPAPAVRYADFAAWQRDCLADGSDTSAAVQLDFWRTTLTGAPVETTLPVDRQRPAAPTGAGDAVPVQVGPELTAELHRLARSHDVTVFMLLHAALAVLLSRHTGSPDVVVGTPISTRFDPALDDAVGYFLNTLALRTDVAPDHTVAELLRAVRGADLDAYDRADVPFSDVVAAVAPDRAPGRSPLFQVMVVCLGGDANALTPRLDGVDASADVVRTGTAKFDASFNFTDTPDLLSGVVEYSTDLFDRSTMERVADRMVAVLRAFAEDPARPVGSIDVLAPADRADAVARAVSAVVDVPDVTIAELLAERAATCPQRTALVSGDERVTFAGFDARVTRLARVLRSRGAGPESVVALGLPRSVDNVVALFAVLRAGAAYVPLELDHPDDRLAEILTASGASLLVTDSAVAARFDGGVEQVRLDEPGLFDGVPDTPLSAEELGAFAPGTPGRLDHPAYVIFTSGSTGKPKGVVTPFRGLTNMQVNHRREIFAPTVDAAGGRVLRIAHTVSFAFDMSWEELLWLVEGHEVHVCDEQLRRDAERLVAYCAEHAVDVVNVTPTYAHHLFAAGLLDGPHVPPLVLLGGEAVPESVWSRLRDTDGTWGYNLYGPTEYTINTLGAGTSDSPTSTVGTAITNTTAHVLDGWLRPVPDGVIGELYIAGTGLARGYLDRPGLTAERFVADPWTPGERMYRTGDLVRRRPDGNLDFLGRSDDQLKIRGYRVEPAEVETALGAVDGVSQAAVVARTTGTTKRLAAYLVGRADVETVRDAVARVLPDYMVPTLWAVVDALPLTVNGKLDTAALPEPAPVARRASRAPRTPLEERLCTIVADVLGLDTVGIDDDFFGLGGDSLGAIDIATTARREGIELRVRDLLVAGTVAAVAAALDRGDGDTGEGDDTVGTAGTAAAGPSATPATEEPGTAPLTPVLSWLGSLGGPVAGRAQAVLVTTPAGFGADDLTALADALLTRHPVLRSALETGSDGHWTGLRILPRRDADPAALVRRVPVDPAAGDDALTRAITAATRTARAELDAGPGGMLRLLWFDRGTAPGRLAVVAHHLAVDGTSWRVLAEDIATHGTGAGPAPEATGFAAFAARLHAHGAGPGVRAEAGFWQEVLDAAVPLPVRRPRDGGDTHATVRETTSSCPGDVVTALARRHGTGAEAVLLAALGEALTVTGPDGPVLVDLEHHGRAEELGPDVDLARTVGCLTVLAPVPAHGSPGPEVPDAAAALTRARDAVAAPPGRGLGWGLLRYPAEGPPRVTGPGAEVALNWLGRTTRPAGTAGGGWELAPEQDAVRVGPAPGVRTGHSLVVDVLVRDTAGGPVLEATFGHPTGVLDAATVDRVAARWAEVLTTWAGRR